MTAVPPALPGTAQNKRLKESHEFTRLLLGKADMRVAGLGHCAMCHSPINALGAKGIGESGTIGSTPAVQSAVCDAVAHLGVRHVDIPATAERVWRAIQAART